MAPKTGKQQRRSRAETCASSKGAKWNKKKNKRNGFYCIKFQEAGKEKKKFAAFGQGHTHVYFEDYNSPDKNS